MYVNWIKRATEAAVSSRTAMVFATIALAEEQRTANLIAFMALSQDQFDSVSEKTQDEVRDRLGLNIREPS